MAGRTRRPKQPPVEIAGVNLSNVLVALTKEEVILRDWGERIARKRELLGIEQDDLAERLGVSFMTIRRWELGQMEPRLKHKMALARELGSMRDLFPLPEVA